MWKITDGPLGSGHSILVVAEGPRIVGYAMLKLIRKSVKLLATSYTMNSILNNLMNWTKAAVSFHIIYLN